MVAHDRLISGCREYKNSNVTNNLKKSVQEWRQIMPIILELGNKALKPKHWDKLIRDLRIR